MMRVRFAIALFLLAFAGATAAQQIYRWTDSAGRTHLTDTPPPADAREVETKEVRIGPSEESQTPYELAVAVRDFPVVLYTSPTCKEGCELARAALNKRAVPFKEVQVWNEETNAALKRASGANEVPTLTVGRSVHRGFEQDAYDALLDSARYPKAGTLPARVQAAPPPPEGYVPPREREIAAKAKAESGAIQTEEPEPRGPYSPGSTPPPRRLPKQ